MFDAVPTGDGWRGLVIAAPLDFLYPRRHLPLTRPFDGGVEVNPELF
jgi:hypothetical protein